MVNYFLLFFLSDGFLNSVLFLFLSGGFVANGRVQGSLAVSRALGKNLLQIYHNFALFSYLIIVIDFSPSFYLINLQFFSVPIPFVSIL